MGIAATILVLNGLSSSSVRPVNPGRAKRVSAKIQINTFEGCLGQYKIDTGFYPTSAQGLSALRSDPGLKGWNGPYVSQEIPLDPWGRLYLYRYPGEHSNEPDIVSFGADGKPGGSGEDEDVTSWKAN